MKVNEDYDLLEGIGGVYFNENTEISKKSCCAWSKHVSYWCYNWYGNGSTRFIKLSKTVY